MLGLIATINVAKSSYLIQNVNATLNIVSNEKAFFSNTQRRAKENINVSRQLRLLSAIVCCCAVPTVEQSSDIVLMKISNNGDSQHNHLTRRRTPSFKPCACVICADVFLDDGVDARWFCTLVDSKPRPYARTTVGDSKTLVT
jgi:hypothetical protein